jgi:hypothetical protein
VLHLACWLDLAADVYEITSTRHVYFVKLDGIMIAPYKRFQSCRQCQRESARPAPAGSNAHQRASWLIQDDILVP